jgi:hypothetical protein
VKVVIARSGWNLNGLMENSERRGMAKRTVPAAEAKPDADMAPSRNRATRPKPNRTARWRSSRNRTTWAKETGRRHGAEPKPSDTAETKPDREMALESKPDHVGEGNRTTWAKAGWAKAGAPSVTLGPMKLLYKPFSIVSGLVGARIGRKLFETVWDGVSDSPKPSAGDPDAGLLALTAASALEAATLAASAALFNQLGARLFHHLFGAWPKTRREKQDEQQPA